ncbi:unnamed protein product [Caenorhabditis auriculariae]|uniref:Uncharacterized protein n=1 Tax=Caenorhabditis auriculariae TaxID=2777116 RepID=A0A8S1HR59_9PELO|nr:unnamed protein product [Caenorhabditis auriculariae]
MGVTRRSHELQPIRVEEIPEFNYADFEMSDEENRRTSESVEVQTSRSRRNKERRAERKLRWSPDDLESDGLKVHRNMGARKWRRVENARSLLDWADREDICEDFSDIFPRTYTAF